MYFYLPNLNSHIIDSGDSGHFFSCRVKAGDKLKITDLQGNLQSIEITQIDPKKHQINYKIVEIFENQPKPITKVLIQAIPDKIYLDKLFEVLPLAKISEVNLFFSDFSLKYNPNLDRLQKILIRSCEQGEIIFKPSINIMTKERFNDIIRTHKPTILACVENYKTKNLTQTSKNAQCILVGPEGGWSGSEIDNFKKLDLEFANMGQTIYPAWLAGFVWFTKTTD